MIGPLAFTAPFVLAALLLLPAIWWLLRLIPPRPKQQAFPPTRLLAELAKKEDTPHKSPWWLTLLRLGLAALAIFALAGPFWQPNVISTGNRPLLLVIDNGWTTAQDWPKRAATARTIIQEAARNNRPVALVMTTDEENIEIRLSDAQDAAEKLAAQLPLPYPEDRATTAKRLETAKAGLGEVDIIWIAGPLETNGDKAFAAALSNIGTSTVRHDLVPRLAVTRVGNGASTLDITVKRLTPATGATILRAHDKDGISLTDVPIIFDDKALEGLAKVELPIELRNEIVRLTLVNETGVTLESAGTTYLIDDRSRRRSVGLLSGISFDQEQPLLSPLYYINRALEPFADIREATTPNLTEAIPTLLQSGVSMMIMADVGTLPPTETERLSRFMERGGTVVRFAGPRLAATEDTLTPVRLRAGDRSLGGSLTWEAPQKLARFSENGPFAGMDLPDDIEIKRQVLAEPDFDLLQKTWAELEDGTPLVTAEPIGDGWLVLFHVTADATWSNLPISGAFVDMLVKLVAFSSVPAGAVTGNGSGDVQSFSPFQTLDAQGRLGPPLETAEPIALKDIGTITAKRTAPPGFYGKAESLIAHNLMKKDTSFKALDPASLLPEATLAPLGQAGTTDLRPAFFTAALILLLADSVIVAAMAGLFSGGLTRRLRPLAPLVLAVLVTMPVTDGNAQVSDETIPFEVTLTTRLGYVITGDADLDEISRAGLFGLTNFISLRTALEPGPPVGVDISKDELAFFPLLYWPVSHDTAIPDTSTMARIDAFMKQGGTVLFDTRDQITASTGTSKANQRLRQIVASLDVPPLEPVPANHVLTRAFYLLQDFPGRWVGSPLWVEATEGSAKSDEQARSRADGVSSILITGNDLAGAWATDENARPLLPTVPGDPTQRVYAYRTGVNIVMYTLTGNYKADQVHIPDLLQRLGQ